MSKELMTVRDLVDYAAEKFGDKDFIRFFRGEEMLAKTYNEFREDALAVCRCIRDTNPGRKHIGFIGKTSYEYVACLTGMIFSGNVVVPFAPDISVKEACELFDDGDIEMLFCEEEFYEKALQIKENFSGLKEIISLGDWQWFDNIFKKYNSQSEYAALSEVSVNPDDMTLIIYTSGTTGIRKGVMLTNHNLAANTSYEASIMDEADVSFSVLPMHHVFCYACDVLRTLYDGGTLCLNGNLKDLYKHILVFQPTVMRIVPSLCKSMLTRVKVIERKNPELTKREAAEQVFGKNFRRMIVGSAFLSAAMIDEYEKYGITPRMGYGMSECSPRISYSDFSGVEKYSTGKLLGTDEVRIQNGEVQVKGPSVMIGYYKKPEATAEAFTEDGFLHTGDLGYLKGDHIFLVGRKKNVIVLANGENISPEEIENKFVDDGIIKEIVVIGEDDKLVAEIYPDYELIQSHAIENVEAEIEKIVDRVNIQLNSDRQIDSFRIREKPFERTSTGKLKRTEFYYN
ncbi:MAG: AMP-binding protein [Acutalibacteraceae bacterium]